MKEMMLMMAKMLPIEHIIDMIANDCEKFKLATLSGNEDDINVATASLELNCVLLTTKKSIGDREVADVLKELDRMKAGSDLLNPSKH